MSEDIHKPGTKSQLQIAPGFTLFRDYFDRKAQEVLVTTLRDVVQEAPLFVPIMPRTGTPMHVRMTNCGSLGWVTDKERGYRYQPNHPVTEKPWPDMPEPLLSLWRNLAGVSAKPEACLVNFYSVDAKMGMHQDRDEATFDAPVISVSLGDSCLFRMGNKTRGGKTTSIRLQSGDVMVMDGEGRLCYHGVDRIYPDTSTLLPKGGRINLTLRRVTKF